MKMPKLLVGVGIAVIATMLLYLAFQDLRNTFIGVICVAVALAFVGWLVHTPRQRTADGRIVRVGTVCTVGDDESETAAGEHQIMVEVTSVHGDTFVGRLAHSDGDPVASWLRPGTVLLVAFDPAAREQLSLPDDVLAVRAAELSSI
jgi:hypothetical protein